MTDDLNDAVSDALAKLDGTEEAALVLVTGLSCEGIRDLGGTEERHRMTLDMGDSWVCTCGKWQSGALYSRDARPQHEAHVAELSAHPEEPA